jgi:hypothetical protein
MEPANHSKAIGVKFQKCRNIREHHLFFKLHFILVVFSFLIPGFLSFYDSDVSLMQTVTTALTIPLVLCHSIVNFVVVFDNCNTFVSEGIRNNSWESKWKYYLAVWGFYDLAKIILVIVYLVEVSYTSDSNQMIAFVVLFFLIFEGINFFLTEFDTPRKLQTTLVKHFSKLAWVIFTMLLITYSFAFLAYCFFKSAAHRNVVYNDWIEGVEFDNIIQSFITMMDIKDWFNSYLIRAIEAEQPGAVLFFYAYIIVARIIDCLFLAMVVQVFTDPVTEELILSIDDKKQKRQKNEEENNNTKQSPNNTTKEDDKEKKITSLQDLRLNIYQKTNSS